MQMREELEKWGSGREEITEGNTEIIPSETLAQVDKSVENSEGDKHIRPLPWADEGRIHEEDHGDCHL